VNEWPSSGKLNIWQSYATSNMLQKLAAVAAGFSHAITKKISVKENMQEG